MLGNFTDLEHTELSRLAYDTFQIDIEIRVEITLGGEKS